ncbi:MAG: hypothetical protein LUQ65_13715, partial [Candidatus Helarchaeota archaeon]|nr:hypothetical protein [Candidatus Helarchaeota archaeon]
MTSHHISFSIDSGFEEIFGILKKQFGNVYSKDLGRFNKLRNGVILGQKLFFRTGSDAAISIFLEELSLEETQIEMISFAGGPYYTMGVLSSYTEDILAFLKYEGFEIES